MQVQCTQCLGSEDIANVFERHVDENLVVIYAGKMEDPFQRTLQVADDPLHIFRLSDIAVNNVQIQVAVQQAEPRLVSNRLLGPAPMRIPVHQRDMAGTCAREVAKQRTAQIAKSSGNQVGRGRIQVRTLICDSHFGAILRSGQDQLPRMLACHHHPHRLFVITVGKGRDLWRLHTLLGKQRKAPLVQLEGQRRVVESKAVHVNGRKAKVSAKYAQPDLRIREHVHLADLAVPPARLQGIQAIQQVDAGQRVEHDVHTLATGGLHELPVPIVAVRIKSAQCAHLAELLTLFVAAGRGIELGTSESNQLNCRLTHAAHCRMNQNRMRGPHACQVNQRIIGRGIHGCEAGGFQHRQRLRHLHYHAFGQLEAICNAAGASVADAISGLY